MPFTKPTILPRWATGSAVVTEPAEPVKDTGFVPGTPADAGHTNWLLNRLYLWMQYLDDPTSFSAQELVTGTLTASGLATAAGFTATANQHVRVSGTGDYKHGDKILQLPASSATPVNVSDGLSGQPATGATGWKYSRSILGAAQFWYGPAAGQVLVFPVVLKIGDRIKAVSARLQDTSGGHTIGVYLHKSAVSSSFFSGSAQVGAVTSAGGGSIQTITASGISATVNSFEMYNVLVQANGTVFTNHRVLGVQVTYDRP